MADDRPPISKIINKWKSEVGEERRSEMGTTYVIIPTSKMRESLYVLIGLLRNCGYSLEEIDAPSVSIKLVDICWRQDKIRKMSNSAVREAKISLASDWQEALDSFFDIEVPEIEKSDIPVYKSESKTDRPPDVPPTEEEMIKMASMSQKLKEATGVTIESEEDEIDTEFMDLMGISSSNEDENE